MKITEIIKELVKMLSAYDLYTQYIENYNQMISRQKANDAMLERAKKFLADNGIIVDSVYGMASRIAETRKSDTSELEKLYKNLYVDILYSTLEEKLKDSCTVAMKNGDVFDITHISEYKYNVKKNDVAYMNDVYLRDIAKQIYNEYCA